MVVGDGTRASSCDGASGVVGDAIVDSYDGAYKCSTVCVWSAAEQSAYVGMHMICM